MSEIDVRVDTKRTCLQRVFFDTLCFETSEELLVAVGDLEVGVDSLARSADARLKVYSGWVYWLLFLKGVLEYRSTGELHPDNTYLDYMERFYLPQAHDPGLSAQLSDQALVRERILMRMDLVEQAFAGEAVASSFPPVCVIVGHTPPQYPLRVFLAGAEQPVAATLVDGWHRLFVAKIWGIESIAGLVVQPAPAAELVPVV